MTRNWTRQTEPFDPFAGVDPSFAGEFEAGRVIAGKYRVNALIGVGGMGMVLDAEHIERRERVAMKRLLPSVLGIPEAEARFLIEARAAMRIKSEHVVRIFDTGRDDSGVPFLVMEVLSGIDLSEHLARHGPLPVREAVDDIIQVCTALEAAHEAGVIHRDLKPENLFLTRRSDGSPLIKVLDFGISKIVPRIGASEGAIAGLTRSRQTLGTPLYMSPEQMESARTVDKTSDIWSLGVILFELLTGKLPYPAESVLHLRRKIQTQVPPSLHDARPDVPLQLEAIFRRCLEKEPQRRYCTAAELKYALQHVMADHDQC